MQPASASHVNSNILKKIASDSAEKRKGIALKFTSSMLPDIDQGKANSRNGTQTERFVSIVPDYGTNSDVMPSSTVERTHKQKDFFLKQKNAHNDNMQDIMYRVNFRDGDFMKVQSMLQNIAGKKSNVGASGHF